MKSRLLECAVPGCAGRKQADNLTEARDNGPAAAEAYTLTRRVISSYENWVADTEGRGRKVRYGSQADVSLVGVMSVPITKADIAPPVGLYFDVPSLGHFESGR